MMPRAERRVLLAAVLLVLCCAAGVSTASRPGRVPEQQQATAASSSTADAARRRRLSQEAPAAAADGFVDAPSCRTLPTAATAKPDASGRLWGWRDGASCAFKDVGGHVLFYLDYTPGEWLHTPACTAPPFPDSSVADSRFKVWGWDASGALCAFKDDQQQPIPIQKKYTRLAWPEASPCVSQPAPTANNSVPDDFGCLWGWERDRNCAFKKQGSSEPLVYDGYNQTCNISASVLRAAQFNADMERRDDSFGAAEDGVLPLPGANAPLPVTGQKRQQEEYKAAEAEELFAKPGNETAPASTAAPATDRQPPTTSSPVEQPPPPVPAASSSDQQPPSDQPGQPTRLLLQAVGGDASDPRFPKGAAASPPPFRKGWSDGGPGGMSPPRHRSRSLQKVTPLLPESRRAADFGAAQGDTVTRPPVPPSKIPEPNDCGLGAITPPGTSAKGGVLCVAKVAASESVFSVSESSLSESEPRDVGVILGHAIELSAVGPEPSKRRLTASMAVATAVATAVAAPGSHAAATATSTGGDAQSVATANSAGNGTALAVSNADASQGNGSAVAVSNANATDGGTAVAQSAAQAKDGINTTVVVDAQAHGPNRSCVLTVAAANGKVFWKCNNSSPAPQPPAATNASGGAAAPPPVTAPAPPGAPAAAGNVPPPPAPAANASAAPPAANSTMEPASNSTTEQASNSTTASYDVLAPSWAQAMVCRAPPNKTNSVQDCMGRLWGYDVDLQRPCAFRQLNGSSQDYPGFVTVAFDTAPPCADAPTSTNSMADEAGNLCGWNADLQENCAFKDPQTGEPLFFPGYAPEPVDSLPEAQAGSATMLPSAAGPGNASVAPPPPSAAVAAQPQAELRAAEGEEAAITKEAVAQTDQIQASLRRGASIKEKANAAARAALTVMVAANALHAAANAPPASGFRAAEADAQPAALVPSEGARWNGIIRETLGKVERR